ncbi:MAG: metallophosphoesterase, partial [candidate division WOR-3 bacterium]|nr:metallophosphoesterase [candidate division WOR-3 bacterium]
MLKQATSFLSVFLLAASSEAAFVKQPYLQNLASSSVVVRFETATPLTGKVQFGLTTSYGAEATDPAPGVDHELTLPSLNADTVYHYRAIAGADTSPDGTFASMASVSRPFRFMAYGDNCVDSTAHQNVVDRMVTVNPPAAFAVNCGDQTIDGGSAQYQTFLNVEAGLLRRTTLFPVMGNHEQDSMANWYRFFALPGNELWYRFRYGNSSFIGLNLYETYTPGSAQYDSLLSWLLADSADANVWHTFVFFHEPPYTTNTAHTPNLTVRTYLCPLFERFKVAVSFQGHVHAWEHSLVNGVHYIITGGGGQPLYNDWNAPDSWTVYREATYEFTLVDVRGDTISCRGVRPDGTVLDSFQFVPPRPDVGCTRILAPAGTVDSGTMTTPQARVKNFGTATASFPVTFTIGTFYADTTDVSNLAPGDSVTVNFSNWVSTQTGTFATHCSTALSGDRIHTNDTLSGTVTVRVLNVGVTLILAPTGIYDSGASVQPQANVKNFGTATASFPVTFTIGTFYA